MKHSGTASTQQKADPTSENRVVGSPPLLAAYVASYGSEAVELRQENGSMGTATVSGVFCWLSNNPIDIEGGLNQYAFVGDNPLNYVDPFGLKFRTSCETFSECWDRCIDTYYGNSGHYAMILSPFGLVQGIRQVSPLALAQGIQQVCNGVIQSVGQQTINNASIAGIWKSGTLSQQGITALARRGYAAAQAAAQAGRLTPLMRVFPVLSIVGAGASGYVFGAAGYCAAQCL